MEKEKEKDKTCEFIIVTGMSGSGKTQACRYLEDIGYFVVPVDKIGRAHV